MLGRLLGKVKKRKRAFASLSTLNNLTLQLEYEILHRLPGRPKGSRDRKPRAKKGAVSSIECLNEIMDQSCESLHGPPELTGNPDASQLANAAESVEPETVPTSCDQPNTERSANVHFHSLNSWLGAEQHMGAEGGFQTRCYWAHQCPTIVDPFHHDWPHW